MDYAGFGSVISCLQLRNVDDMSTHTRSSNKAAVCEALKFVAVNVGTLLLLASPVSTGGSGTVECAVQIGSDNLTVVINFPVKHGTLCPWNTSIGDENVEATVEFFDDFGN